MDDTSTSFPSWLLSIAFALSISFMLMQALRSRSKKPSMAAVRLPPSPPTLPLIGNTHQVVSKKVHRTLWQLAQKYGPVMLIHTGTKPLLVISSSELAKEVLKTNHDVFSTRPQNKGNKRLTYNNSDIIFGPASEHWRQMRRVLVHELLGPKRFKRFNQVLNVEIEGVLNDILSSNPLRPWVNINDMALSLVYGVVCKLAFGKSYTEKPFNGVTVKQMLVESTYLVTGSFADMFPTYGWILDKLTGWNNRLDKCFSNFDGYFEMSIDKHLQTGAETSDDEEDFVDVLIELSQKEPSSVGQ